MKTFLGQIILMATRLPPEGFHMCDGRELKIAEYGALFSVIGYQYTPDYKASTHPASKTFRLPDLRGRMVGGRSAGHPVGSQWGQRRISLSESLMPAHSHRNTEEARKAFMAPVSVSGEIPAFTPKVSITTYDENDWTKVTNLPGGNFLAGQRTITASGTTQPEVSGYVKTTAAAPGKLAGVSAQPVTLTAKGRFGKLTASAQTVGMSVPAKSEVFLLNPPALGLSYFIAYLGSFPMRDSNP